MIEILRSLLAVVLAHPEIVPSLGRMIESIAGARDKHAAVRAAEAAAAKVAIRS